MDLRRRLADLDRLSRRPAAGPEPRDPAGDPVEALAALLLTRTEGASGPVWIRDYREPLPAPCDPLPDLGGFFTREVPGDVAAGDLLFLDTETTGLAGGTGTIPFLVGISWWSGGGLHTRQYFLPGPGREGPVLAALAERAAAHRIVVTFNGASYDLPLLRTRARLERRGDPLAGLVSWDLLVPARRLWGRALADCRQQTLEREVLGRDRTAGDIDGSRIPQTWFDFLATGRAGDLPAVLRHNRRDMAGMAALLGAVVEARRALHGSGARGAGSWRDAWARARICERRRDDRGAARWVARSLDGARREGIPVGSPPGFVRDAVRILKRAADWSRVEAVLAAALAARPRDPWLHREAAILFEHRLGDLDRALRHARGSGEDHRIRRLEVRLARLGRGGPGVPRKEARA